MGRKTLYISAFRPINTEPGASGAGCGAGVEPRRQVVEVQFLQALADGVKLAGAVVDQGAALFAELEGLAEAGLAGVEAVDDLLEALDRVLVARRGAVSHDDLLRLRVRDQQRLGRRLVHR
jgi:hypothetical protein